MVTKAFFEQLEIIAELHYIEVEDVLNVVEIALIKACQLEGYKGEISVEFNMEQKKIRIFVVLTALLFLIAGTTLFIVFQRQGLNKSKVNSYINYNVNDYVKISPVVFNNYGNVYSSINVSRIRFSNIDESLTEEFILKQEEFINYITGYYNQINVCNSNYGPVSLVSSSIKTQINGAVLSVFYRLDFILDESVFSDNVKSYIVTVNIDLRTNKILTGNDLLLKYDYSKDYISDKLFNEDVLVDKGQIVVDKATNMSLTRSDIERKKIDYVNKIISEFDNIINMYIDNSSLVLVYNVDDLKSIFFDNEFDTDIRFKYLK